MKLEFIPFSVALHFTSDVITTDRLLITKPHASTKQSAAFGEMASASLLKDLKPNIGVFTDPEHNLYIDAASPSVEELSAGNALKEGEVVIKIRSTGICGLVFLQLSPKSRRIIRCSSF